MCLCPSPWRGKLAYAAPDLAGHRVRRFGQNDGTGKKDSDKDSLAHGHGDLASSPRGESRLVQVAVRQVVMNRVHHKLYPDTICGVVYQNQSSSATPASSPSPATASPRKVIEGRPGTRPGRSPRTISGASTSPMSATRPTTTRPTSTRTGRRDEEEHQDRHARVLPVYGQSSTDRPALI